MGWFSRPAMVPVAGIGAVALPTVGAGAATAVVAVASTVPVGGAGVSAELVGGAASATVIITSFPPSSPLER